MKRGGTPKEVASAILWLLSSEVSYATGAILNVSGAARKAHCASWVQPLIALGIGYVEGDRP